MFSNLRFVSLETGQIESLITIDERICKHLGVDVDPKEYHRGWNASIAFPLSNGRTFDEVRNQLLELKSPSVLIVDYLSQHYYTVLFDPCLG